MQKSLLKMNGPVANPAIHVADKTVFLLMKKYLAELTGTFALVFFGTGSAIVNEVTHGVLTNIGIGITFGLIVMIMIYALGHISGAHINPAVTLALFVNKNLPAREVAPYIVSQCAGALLASYCLRFLFPGSLFLGMTQPQGGSMQSFVLEIILTLFLMLVILLMTTVKDATRMLGGFAIGGVVLLEAIFAGPVSGASMNPARSLAPAIAVHHYKNLWIYLTAPIIGAFIAVFIYRLLNNKR